MEQWQSFRNVLFVICVIQLISFLVLFVRNFYCLHRDEENPSSHKGCKSKNRAAILARLLILFLDMILMVLYIIGIFLEKHRFLLPWVILHFLSILFIIGRAFINSSKDYLLNFQAYLDIFVGIVIWVVLFVSVKQIQQLAIDRVIAAAEDENYTEQRRRSGDRHKKPQEENFQ